MFCLLFIHLFFKGRFGLGLGLANLPNWVGLRRVWIAGRVRVRVRDLGSNAVGGESNN
jgi:hypothetical protein